MYTSHFQALSTQLVQPSFSFGKLQFRFNMLTFSSPFMSGPNFYPSRSINFFRRHFLCLFERVAASFQSPSAAESLLVKLAQPNGFRQLQSTSISSRFLSDEEETRTLFWAFSCFFLFSWKYGTPRWTIGGGDYVPSYYYYTLFYFSVYCKTNKHLWNLSEILDVGP